ncbi:radial spoke head protein 3 homolog isoform X2 [Rhea pennata]|uniref:radial spoke head protein 3 homolog isoform X2 n=1 Tax=Rhea pennata TaxID=8795 RepID=UPI002E2728D5
MEAISFSRPAEAKQYPIQVPATSEEGLGHSAELHSEDHGDEAVECQVECQKSHLLHTSPSPLTTEAAIGRHVAAQAGQREVSHFDLQVEPLLQALLHVTLEQASLEVTVEEELAYRWAQQCTYLHQYNAELAERREEQERRYREEEECGRHRYMQGQQQQEEATQKTAARAFAQCYLADPTPSLLISLLESGDFCNQPETDIETEFLPWWTAEAEEALETRLLGKAGLDSNLSQVTRTSSQDPMAHP